MSERNRSTCPWAEAKTSGSDDAVVGEEKSRSRNGNAEVQAQRAGGAGERGMMKKDQKKDIKKEMSKKELKNIMKGYDPDLGREDHFVQ